MATGVGVASLASAGAQKAGMRGAVWGVVEGGNRAERGRGGRHAL